MADARNLVQLLAKKPFVSLRSRNRDFDQVVVFAGEEISLHHFRQLRQRLAEALEDLVVMPLQRDLDDDGVRQSKGTLVQERDIAIDESCLFQRFHPVPARRRRQVHRFGQLLIAGAPVAAQGTQDVAVDLVQLIVLHSGVPFPSFLLFGISIFNLY